MTPNVMIHHAQTLIKNVGLWLLWVPFRKIAQSIPRAVGYKITSLAGLAIYALAGELRRITGEEIAKCLDASPADPLVRQAVRQSFIMDVRRRFEDLILGTLTKQDMAEMVRIEGIENLDDALSRGKGVIILLSHFGSFLMILPALGFRGYKINQIGGPPLDEQLGFIHKKIFKMRKKAYATLPVRFLRSDLALKDAIVALKRNELVAIAFDGRIGESWVPIEFCGKKINVAPGPVKFAMKTGAAILPTFIIMNPDNTHKLVIEKTIALERFDDKAMTVRFNLQNISDVFEKYIVHYPSHFGMILTIIRKRIEKGIINIPFFVESHRIPEDVSVPKS